MVFENLKIAKQTLENELKMVREKDGAKNTDINQNTNNDNSINQSMENTNKIINQSIENHIKPLLDNIMYYQEENKKYQKLL